MKTFSLFQALGGWEQAKKRASELKTRGNTESLEQSKIPFARIPDIPGSWTFDPVFQRNQRFAYNYLLFVLQ